MNDLYIYNRMLVFYNTWSIEEKAMEIAIKYECCYWSEPLCIICRHGEVLKMCTPWMKWLLSMLHLNLHFNDVFVSYATIGAQLCIQKKQTEKLLHSYWLNLYIGQLIGCLLNKILLCCGNEFIIGILREKIQRPKNGETFNIWITCIWQEF